MNKAVHVLYVEDNEGDVELLKMCIERSSSTFAIELDVAETIEEAKSIFNSEKHVAAIVDWNLPDGEGTELIQFMRAMNSSFPVILVSGIITEAHKHSVNEFSPISCLSKDYSSNFIDELSNIIKEFLH